MAIEIKPTRKDTWAVTVEIDGDKWGIWDVKTGGEVDSDQAAPYKPGGMQPAIAMGGSVTTGNLTLSRMCRLERDWSNINKLVNGAGKAGVIVTQAAKDTDGNDYHANPIVYKGKLKRVLPPEVDSNSTDVALVEIEVVVDGTPTFGGGGAATP